MASKILTIIVPTYNMEKYLHKCLDSLLVSEKNMECLEVLVINDGSKDSSSQIAHEYETKFPQTFKVIDKENGNYGSCINRGLKEAMGKYVKVLDADDYFDKRTLPLYIETLSKQDVDLILSDFEMVNTEGKKIKSIRYSKFEKDQVIGFNYGLAHSDIWMHAVAYRTENLRTIDYKQTEGISYTDQEWIFMPMVTVGSFYYFSQPLYRYVIGREGQTVNKKVYARNFAQEVKGLMVMAEAYCNTDLMKYPEWVRVYLKGRLLHRCDAVYSNYLFSLKKFLDLNELKEIDSRIKEKYHPIYDLSANHGYSAFKYHYIQDWRNSGYHDTLKLKLYRMYITLKSLFFFAIV